MLARDLVLPHRLAAIAAEAPDRELLVRADTGERVTYGAFQESVLRWAGALERLGINAGDRVATVLRPSTDAYATWIAVSWLRAIEVPVNTALTGPLLTHVLGDSGARIAIASADLLPAVAGIAVELPDLEAIVVIGEPTESVASPVRILPAADVFGAPPDASMPGPEPYDICCLCYTSGTTGPAKGVLVPWAEQWEFTDGTSAGIDDTTVYYSIYPMFHVSGKHALYTAALSGRHLVFREQFSVQRFWPDVREHGCTAVGLIGPMARMLFIQPPQDDDGDNLVQWSAVGPMFPEIAEFGRRFNVRVVSGYGMTEIGAPLMTFDVTDWQSCGRARDGYDLRIVDEHDAELPHGQVGELIVRSDQPWRLNAGYWGRPELTAHAWRNGWFHTGDAFRRNEAGDFYFVDRLKDSMRRRGENISSFEVEMLVNTADSVAESAAVPVPSELGEDDIKIVVVPKQGVVIDPEVLLKELDERMPRYMRPRCVEVVDALPKTPTSRVRKVELRTGARNVRTWDRETGCYS